MDIWRRCFFRMSEDEEEEGTSLFSDSSSASFSKVSSLLLLGIFGRARKRINVSSFLSLRASVPQASFRNQFLLLQEPFLGQFSFLFNFRDSSTCFLHFPRALHHSHQFLVWGFMERSAEISISLERFKHRD